MKEVNSAEVAMSFQVDTYGGGISFVWPNASLPGLIVGPLA